MKSPQTLQTVLDSTNLPLKYRLSLLQSKRCLILHAGPQGKAMFFQRKSLMKLLLLQLCKPQSMWLLALVSDQHLIQKNREQKRSSSDNTELTEWTEQGRPGQSGWALTAWAQPEFGQLYEQVSVGSYRNSNSLQSVSRSSEEALHRISYHGSIRNGSFPAAYSSSCNIFFWWWEMALPPCLFTAGFDRFFLGKVVGYLQVCDVGIAMQTLLPWDPCKGPRRRQISVGLKTSCRAPDGITRKPPPCSQKAKITFGKTKRLERACW